MTEQINHAKLTQKLEEAERANAELEKSVNDRWYPTFHIAAKAGWINDPNGLSFYQGRYHTFFQHHPYGSTWGPMHWGHVSSEDLVHWKREPIALAPTLEADRDGVFSGSAVTGDDGRLYAYYTGHRWTNGINEDEGSDQVQCLATSEDGVHFEKQGVVVEGPQELPNFRDPKVFRVRETWYMVFGATSTENRGQVWMYTSTDMFEWTFDRILFEDPNPEVFMLECPDFFELNGKWVLTYCPMTPTPAGYDHRNSHNAGYVVGDWAPGNDFRQLTDYRQTDRGHNFYAPQTFEAPNGRRLGYGWMGSFSIPLAPQLTDSWSGQLTVPLEFSLTEDLKLAHLPIKELEQLRGSEKDLGAFTLDINNDMVVLDESAAYDLELTINLAESTTERVGLQVGLTEDGAHTYVGYDRLAGTLFIDRRLAGNGDRGYRATPYVAGEKLKLRVLVDRGSVEVFADDGVESLSSFTFANAGPRALVLSSESGTLTVDSLKVWEMGSIWS
ncbi:glycoside hydrolase family 32 protein [Rothia aerolata]|uniref:Sucrose-6-phosphate hydrolase n=1 Tax=Rothia aerolata TaxID=1812262 RepID=A0A917MV40_9MICC|nr:glycoside hydrolase family 32 protein [Rothia aerolata]GGH65637.1 beta-fructofuranosidase [Rothia aerolata]